VAITTNYWLVFKGSKKYEEFIRWKEAARNHSYVTEELSSFAGKGEVPSGKVRCWTVSIWLRCSQGMDLEIYSGNVV
jgi:hypothetical protein